MGASSQVEGELTPEDYLTLSERLNGTTLAPNDADTTKANIRNIQKKWIRYDERRLPGISWQN